MIKPLLILTSIISSIFNLENNLDLMLKSCANCNSAKEAKRKLELAAVCSRKLSVMVDFNMSVSTKASFKTSNSSKFGGFGTNIMSRANDFASSQNGKIFVKTAVHVSSEVASHMIFPKSPMCKVAASVAMQEGAHALIDQMTSKDK